MYRYETHLHTFPVSKCAKNTPEEQLLFYREQGFEGVFITNHFLDGNVNVDKSISFARQIDFYLSDYEKAKEAGQRLGISVFFGVELSHQRTDFLVYGLSPAWYRKHPEVPVMEKNLLLPYLMEAGALIIHAHPFREGKGIHFMRLCPWAVHGAEIYNACRSERENKMAELYVSYYDLIPFAGSDTHKYDKMEALGGMEFETPIADEEDFVRRVLAREGKPFVQPIPRAEEEAAL